MKDEHALIDFWSGSSFKFSAAVYPIKTELCNQGNGGDGGDASSGSAYAYGPGAKAYSGPGGNAAGGDVHRRTTPVDVRTTGSKRTLYLRFSPRENYDPAHPGAGKYTTSEGGHHDRDNLVQVGSGAFFGCYMHPGVLERCTQETAETAAMPSLGTPTRMVMERLRILALVAMHPGAL